MLARELVGFGVNSCESRLAILLCWVLSAVFFSLLNEGLALLLTEFSCHVFSPLLIVTLCRLMVCRLLEVLEGYQLSTTIIIALAFVKC